MAAIELDPPRVSLDMVASLDVPSGLLVEGEMGDEDEDNGDERSEEDTVVSDVSVDCSERALVRDRNLCASLT